MTELLDNNDFNYEFKILKKNKVKYVFSDLNEAILFYIKKMVNKYNRNYMIIIYDHSISFNDNIKFAKRIYFFKHVDKKFYLVYLNPNEPRNEISGKKGCYDIIKKKNELNKFKINYSSFINEKDKCCLLLSLENWLLNLVYKKFTKNKYKIVTRSDMKNYLFNEISYIEIINYLRYRPLVK